MIQCKECGFSVNELMRFALMKNVCPSCGSGLISGQDANIISVIQSRLSSQRFSSSLTENQLYDISLFIFNELKHDFGQFASELRASHYSAKKRSISKNEDPAESEELDSDEEVGFSEDDLDVESIRREVVSELSEKIPSNLEDEDTDSKAERLKRLYQQRVVSGGIPESAPKVKRGSGFKGVTRST